MHWQLQSSLKALQPPSLDRVGGPEGQKSPGSPGGPGQFGNAPPIGSGVAKPGGTGIWARAGAASASPSATSATPIHHLAMIASPNNTPRVGRRIEVSATVPRRRRGAAGPSSPPPLPLGEQSAG